MGHTCKTFFYLPIVLTTSFSYSMDLGKQQKKVEKESIPVSYYLGAIEKYNGCPLETKLKILNHYLPVIIPQDTRSLFSNNEFYGCFLHTLAKPSKKNRFRVEKSEEDATKIILYYDPRKKKEFEIWKGAHASYYIPIIGPNQRNQMIINKSFFDISRLPSIKEIPLTNKMIDGEKTECIHPFKSTFLSLEGSGFIHINKINECGEHIRGNIYSSLYINHSTINPEIIKKIPFFMSVNKTKFGPSNTVFVIEHSSVCSNDCKASFYDQVLVQYNYKQNKKVQVIGGTVKPKYSFYPNNMYKILEQAWRTFQKNCGNYFKTEKDIEKAMLLFPTSFAIAIEHFKYSLDYPDYVLLKCQPVFNMDENYELQYISPDSIYMLYNLKTKKYGYLGLCEKLSKTMLKFNDKCSYTSKLISKDTTNNQLKVNTFISFICLHDYQRINEVLLASAAYTWLKQKKDLEQGKDILRLLENSEIIGNKYYLIWKTNTLFKNVYYAVKTLEKKRNAIKKFVNHRSNI